MKIKRDENKKISCTPPGKISNIIFEKKNTTQAKVKIYSYCYFFSYCYDWD